MLSHEDNVTNPSKRWTLHMISIEAARTSLIGNSYFKFSVPRATDPHVENSPNSKGVPPAYKIPVLTADDNCLRWECPGETSLHAFATPINGLLRSKSEYPVAL